MGILRMILVYIFFFGEILAQSGKVSGLTCGTGCSPFMNDSPSGPTFYPGQLCFTNFAISGCQVITATCTGGTISQLAGKLSDNTDVRKK